MTHSALFRIDRVLGPLMGLLCLAGLALPAWAQFETRARTPFPQGADSIALGDFNNDGILDVVMITDNGFSVALGNGDGTFQAPITTRTQLSYSLAVADFNNDGNLDIVMANEDGSPSTVSVYLGNGDGTFKAPIDSVTDSDNQLIVVGDFNGDGKPDIAVASNISLGVLLGNGDGTFGPESSQTGFGEVHALAVGDFNNDSKLDLLVTGYPMGVFLGNGDGTLQPPISTALSYTAGSGVVAADLNGDGKTDVVLGYDFSGIAVFLGNGDGTFQPPANYGTTGISGGYVVVKDLNLDGKLDVSVPSTEGTAGGLDVYWGNGDGTLEAPQFFATDVSGIPAVGDLNGDGLPDFALGNTLYGLGTMLNTGVVSFSPSTAPLTFPVQVIDTTSAKQTVNLTNSGSKPLSISSVSVSGEFQMSTTCRKSLASGADCTISASFKPTGAGSLSGLIIIVDSASSKPQFIELSGTATVVKVSPSSLNFGDQEVGTKSKPQIVTAKNVGSVGITFSSVGVTARQTDFSSTDNCTGRTIEPGASCEVSVVFDPTETGMRSAYLYFDLPKGSIGPAPVVLSGEGT